MMLILRYLMYTQIQGHMYGYNTQGYKHTAFGFGGGGQSGQKMKGIKRRFFGSIYRAQRGGHANLAVYICIYSQIRNNQCIRSFDLTRPFAELSVYL